MCRILLLMIFIGIASDTVMAQGIHAEDNERYSQLGLSTEQDYDRLNGTQYQKSARTSVPAYQLRKKVFGFNPYFAGTAYQNYAYESLTTLAYFSYEVNPATGGYLTVRDWKTTAMVSTAKANGVSVVLTATNFGNANNTLLLSSVPARKVLIDSLLRLVQLRQADGVNIDFESVPSAMRDSLTRFMRELSVKFKAVNPRYQISIDIPAVDWSNAFDVAAMNGFVDDFIVMGYDYFFSGSTKTGPVAPLINTATFGNLSITKSVDDWLAKGIPPTKLLLAVPYYGRGWETTGLQPGANTVSGTSFSKQYGTAKTEILTHGRLWNTEVRNPYYSYASAGKNYQVWYDDAESLEQKYDLVNTKNIGGIGIWAVYYEGNSRDLSDVIRNKFSDSPILSTSSTTKNPFRVYPNPVKAGERLVLEGTLGKVILRDLAQRNICIFQADEELIAPKIPGLYLLVMDDQVVKLAVW